MKQLQQPFMIHTATLATLHPDDQEIIHEWSKKGLYKKVGSYENKTKINP